MPLSLLDPKDYLSLESVKLGRFILDPVNPHADPFDPVHLGPPRVIATSQLQNLGEESDTKNTSFGTVVGSLLSTQFAKQRCTNSGIETKRINSYLLVDSRTWFRDAVGNDKTREWIQDAHDSGEDIFLVVGYRTVVDAEVSEEVSRNFTFGVESEAPIAETLTATGVILPFGEVVNPSVNASRERGHAAKHSFLLPGEMIYAVQYRKVRYKWYKPKEFHKKRLGPCQWRPSGFLGGDEDEDDEEEGEDVFGVELEYDEELDKDFVLQPEE